MSKFEVVFIITPAIGVGVNVIPFGSIVLLATDDMIIKGALEYRLTGSMRQPVDVCGDLIL